MAHWLVDTAGIGSIIVLIVAGTALVAYTAMVRWIAAAPRAKERGEQGPAAASNQAGAQRKGEQG